MSDIYLITISGEDKPGELSSLMSVLAENEANILDINQVVIHKTLSLGILAEFPDPSRSSAVLKELLFKAHTLNLNLKYNPVVEDEYEQWVTRQGKKRYIITLLGRKIAALHLSKVSRIIHENGLNIDIITRLSGRPSLKNDNGTARACVEISVRGTPHDIKGMKAVFMDMTQEGEIDIAFQEDNAYRRNRRLVAFDMDSTLIQTEVIDELARKAGVGEQVSSITEAAMRGEFNFNESLKKRLSFLKGLDENVMKEIAESLPLTEGAERLIANLKRFGFKTAILSGGFSYFGKYLQKKLGIDYVYTNELEITDGKLTGNVIGDIVNGEKKAELLKEIARRENISLEQVIAVGDGANDLPMINIAGLGIAFHAKPIVKKGAAHAISTLGLDGILYLIGIRDRDTLA